VGYRYSETAQEFHNRITILVYNLFIYLYISNSTTLHHLKNLRMKIIIIGPAFPFRGGIADTNESLCETLIEEGHDASLVTFTVQYPSFLFPGKTQFTTDKKPDHIPIIRLIHSINPFNWLKVAAKINKLKPDLVIVRYWIPFLSPCLGTITRLLKKSIVKIAMCDNVIPHEKRTGDKVLTKYFIKSFNGFITLSNTTYQELNLFTKRPKTYFPHPINKNLGEKVPMDLARTHLNLESNGKYLLFFGLIREYKGLDITIKALAQPSLRKLDIKLLIVGEFYESKEKYTKLIEKNNLNDHVIIVDEYISLGDLKYWFSAADMAVQTYKTASQSGVTQIAYNFDCPILVTNVGGLSEVVLHEKVGYVCEKNPEEIAEHIQNFFINDMRDTFVTNIKKEKEKYSWNKFVKEIIVLYQSITSEKESN